MKTLTRAAAFVVVFLLLPAPLVAAIDVPVALRPGVSAEVVVQSYAHPAAPPDAIDGEVLRGVEGSDAVHNVFNPAALVHPIKKVINAIDR
jgi:hypothetical protein